MSRERKGGLAVLLHQGPIEEQTAVSENIPVVVEEPRVPEEKTTSQKPESRQTNETEPEEQITIKAPKRYLKVIDRYRLAMIIKTGNVNYSKKEAFSDIMKFFEENSPVELPEE